MRISRIVVILGGALFAAVGLGFWLAPEQAAQAFHLEALGSAGRVTLRADLGGLFVGLAVLCIIGAWKRRAALLIAAALILAAILVGRILGLIVGHGADPASYAIEIIAIAALLICARNFHATGADASSVKRGALIVAGIAAVALIGVVVIFTNGHVQQAMFERAARRLVPAESAYLLEDDALRVAICGSSGPPPSRHRAKACVAVMAGGKFYIVDPGPESVENLMLWGIPMSRIGGVLITHFHSDHIGDLGELNLNTWVQGRPGPLPVYGGTGVDQVVAGFNQAYRLDQGYRTVHHTARLMPAETWPLVPHPLEPTGETQPRAALVMEEGGLRITAIEVDHGPVEPALAYRFDYKGRSVVITGDIEPYPPLALAASGADVLVSEALARPMIETIGKAAGEVGRDRIAAIMHDIQDYHISPTEVADISNAANVRLLVLYHLLPAPDNPIARRLFAHGLDDVRNGEWDLAQDGSLYTLPLGTETVRIGRVGD